LAEKTGKNKKILCLERDPRKTVNFAALIRVKANVFPRYLLPQKNNWGCDNYGPPLMTEYINIPVPILTRGVYE
jgi:hypothetical protein